MAEIPELTLRDRLRISREHAGLTQPGMAAEIRLYGEKISASTIVRLELNKTPIRDWHLRAWAKVTSVPYHWLKTGEVPSGPGVDDFPWTHQTAGQPLPSSVMA